MSLEVTLHQGPLEAVLGDWERLHAGQPSASPFMSAGWARAWWPHWADGARPFVLMVRDGRETVAMAPLVVRLKGPLRVLEPVGMDPGDYWDVLAAPGYRDAASTAVAGALRANGGRWDAWILRCPPPDSPVVAALDATGLPALVRPPIAAPAIELPDTFDAYLKSMSSSRRQNLRKHLRRLDNGEVELVEVSDVAALPAVVERWQDFRRRQWAAAGKDINPEHLSPRFAAFMLACLRQLVPLGTAVVWEFRRAGEIIATYLNFADDEAFYWYLGGFDPEHNRLGIGKIAIGHGIRTSIEAGRARYDFARGDEPYKYWYGAVDRPLAARVVASGGARGRLALLAAQGAVKLRERGRDHQPG